MADLGAFFGNPNIQRQGARARALAGQRDVNTLPDPLTYAVMQGLLGTRPDEMGFSVLNPDYEKIKKVAEPAFALGLLGQAAPVLAPLTKGLPVGASIKSLDDIFKKYPDVTIDASVGKKDINLSRIVVPKEMRNQGVGTQVMSDLSEYADSIGKRITLTPSGDFGGSVPKLKTFYKELGFVENKGKNKDFSTRETMYREPNPIEQTATAPTLETGLLGSKVPSPSSLTMPDVPTVEQMQKFGRVETVPLSQAVSFQSARNWDKFNKGEYSGDLVKGFGDKPLALRLENGEYIIYDGNHRTDLAMQAGKTEIPMNVIDVKSYDPSNAGRRPVPPSMTDDELLRSLLD
jgi:GNAT superfamily N-acetyltransferase